MSLIQHVTQQEGTDREEALVDLFLSPIDRYESREQASERRHSFQSQYSNAGFLQPGKSVRRVISYDTLHKPLEPVAGDVDGGVTQYNVSTFKRAGTYRRACHPTSLLRSTQHKY
jgi:hypothetical protein